MPRNKIIYDQAELDRPVNFILVIADRMLDVSVIDCEEARSYVSAHGRKALIVSDKPVFSEVFPKVKLEVVMNATSPAVRVVETSSRPYSYVYERLLKLYKNGLLICDRDTLTTDIASVIAQAKGIGLDIVMHRDNLIQLSPHEIRRINFVRFHYNTHATYSPEHITVLSSYYGDYEGFGLLLSQYITNRQHTVFQQYFNTESKKYVLAGFTNFVNRSEHDRQAAYYVYYDLVKNKVIGINNENFKKYINEFIDVLKIDMSDKEREQLTDFYHGDK